MKHQHVTSDIRSVPFNGRETINEVTWVDDEGQKIYLPANARYLFIQNFVATLNLPSISSANSLALSFIHLQRDETYWGPDAHVFDPDRWLDSRLQLYTSNPFIFVPFNAGPRIVRS